MGDKLYDVKGFQEMTTDELYNTNGGLAFLIKVIISIITLLVLSIQKAR